MATLKISEVSDLTIKPSTVTEKTINATFKYSTSNKGDYKYFKNFKVAWHYSYKDGGTTINRQDESTENRSTSSSEQTIQWTIPNFNVTKVKTIDIYVTIEPDFDKKTVKVTDSNGKSKSKEQKIPSTKKKSNTLNLNLGEQEEVATPPVPTVEVQSDQSIKLTIKGYNYESNFARSVGVQVLRNGKVINKDILKQMQGKYSVGNFTWMSSPMKDGNYYEYRVKGFNHTDLKGNASKFSDKTDRVYAKPKQPKGNIYTQNGQYISGNTSSLRPNIVINDIANEYDMIKSYIIEYSLDYRHLKQNRYNDNGIDGYAKKEYVKGIDPESGIFKPADSGKGIYARLYIDEFKTLTTSQQDETRKSNTIYFRIVAVNTGEPEQQSDRATDISDFYTYVGGSRPLVPTTWSSKSSYVDDESIILNFINNSTDGSYMQKYELQFKINDVETDAFEYESKLELGEKQEPTYSHNLGFISDLLKFYFGLYLTGDDPQIRLDDGYYPVQYRIRTKGAYDGYISQQGITYSGWSDWAPYKLLEVYRKPWIKFEDAGDDWLWDPFDFRYDTIYTAYDGTPFPETVTHFPLFIGVDSGPLPQTALEYQFKITALHDYDILDYDGSTKHVLAGDIIWSTFSSPTADYFNDNNNLNHCLARINPWDISLDNGTDPELGTGYMLTCSVTMSSGLTASISQTFGTNYEDADFQPTALITLDQDLYAAYITPRLDEVEYDEGETPVTLEDVVFHIFRRNYDGTQTEVASAINGDVEVAVTDPHPALNGASYRIVGMSKITGRIQFIDVPGVEFDDKAIIIQWDGETQNFDLVKDWEDETEDPDNLMLYGSGVQNNMIVLPYNIDATNNYDMDKELVKYIGRENPVSYYGTQKGESLTLSTVIPKTSSDIIYALRRLSIYKGDCYIREPNGTGFWANVTASFNINHLEVTVPVSITATRVEGGL